MSITVTFHAKQRVALAELHCVLFLCVSVITSCLVCCVLFCYTLGILTGKCDLFFIN